MKLSEIESFLGVSFPKRWHEIYNTGAMEWLEVGEEKFRENRERYINDPKSFLMLNCDCEPLMFHEIPKRLDDLNEWISWRSKDEGLALKSGIQIIPFAATGGGDLFCFLYEGTEEPKVILYYHDYYENPEVWENLDRLLYVEMLNAACNEQDIDGADWKENLKYLRADYREMLEGKSRSELADEFEELWSVPIDIWEKK